MLHRPTWETDSPASSISWSMEKAPVLISSLSRAAAAFAERVCCTPASVEFEVNYFYVSILCTITKQTTTASPKGSLDATAQVPERAIP